MNTKIYYFLSIIIVGCTGDIEYPQTENEVLDCLCEDEWIQMNREDFSVVENDPLRLTFNSDFTLNVFDPIGTYDINTGFKISEILSETYIRNNRTEKTINGHFGFTINFQYKSVFNSKSGDVVESPTLIHCDTLSGSMSKNIFKDNYFIKKKKLIDSEGNFKKYLNDEGYLVDKAKNEILLYDVGVYEGEIVNYRPAGKGIIKYFNGDVYEGEFKNYYIRHGNGIYTFKNGEKQEGVFKDGIFLNKNKEGVKTKVEKSNEISDKQRSNKTVSGEETLNKNQINYKNGTSYKGDLKNGKPNGKGIMSYFNGDKYTGEFKDGILEGLGEFKSANGEIYSGEFTNGNRHGIGKIVFLDGSIYEGIVVQNEMTDGSIIYPNGNSYKGNFKKGYPDGYGIFISKDGSKIEGFWKKGIQ